jgi:hypothetical protein
MDVAGPQGTASQVTELVENEQRVIAGATKSLSFPVLGELLDELEEASVAGRLGSLDLLHLPIEGVPAHALGLGDGIANAAVRAEGHSRE